MKKTNLCTPYAKLKLLKLTDNIDSFAKTMYSRGISLRPHIKTHKCCEIAKRQIKCGAKGITASRLHEAEAMASCEIDDIFLAYPVVGQSALKAFRLLNKKCRMTVAVDSIFHLETLLNVASPSSIVRVRIEIDSGQNRCGVLPESTELKKICDFLKFNNDKFFLDGVFTHPGHVYACANSEQIRKIARNEENSVIKAAQRIRSFGFDCPEISVGSTPTAMMIENNMITECRPGNYVFFDAIQVANGTCNLDKCALTIVSTVIGAYNDHLVIDAGSKALGLDKGAHGIKLVQGYGKISGFPELEIASLSEEHGVVTFASKQKHPAAGELIEIIPNHACAAANMFSQYQVFNNDSFFTTWKIEARR